MWEALEKALNGHSFILLIIALCGWGIKQIKELFSVSRKSRMDVLKLWDSEAIKNDFRLEALTRHMFGKYLPADVIRRLLEEPYSTRLIYDLTEIWDVCEYDRLNRIIRLKEGPAWGRALGFFGLYFACGILAFTLGYSALQNPNLWLQVPLAFACLGCVVGAWNALDWSGKWFSVMRRGKDILEYANSKAIEF